MLPESQLTIWSNQLQLVHFLLRTATFKGSLEYLYSNIVCIVNKNNIFFIYSSNIEMTMMPWTCYKMLKMCIFNYYISYFQGVANHYGVHPFYMCVEGIKNGGHTHGVLLLNSNAQGLYQLIIICTCILNVHESPKLLFLFIHQNLLHH